MSERRPGFLVNFFVRAVIGMAMIFFVNEFLSMKEIQVSVGLNAVSFVVSGALGIPGCGAFIRNYVLQHYVKHIRK